MTDYEIIKALKCCISADCLKCPCWTGEWYSGMCNDFLKDVLCLIENQKKQIDCLKSQKEYAELITKRLRKYIDEMEI